MKVGSKLVMKQMVDKSNQDVWTCVTVGDLEAEELCSIDLINVPGATHVCRIHVIHLDP